MQSPETLGPLSKSIFDVISEGSRSGKSGVFEKASRQLTLAKDGETVYAAVCKIVLFWLQTAAV